MATTETKLNRYEKIGKGTRVYFVGEVLNTQTNEVHYATFYSTGTRIEEITPAYNDLESAQMALDIMADDMGWRWCGAVTSYPRYQVDRRKLYKEKLWSI